MTFCLCTRDWKQVRDGPVGVRFMNWKEKARKLKRDTRALMVAVRHPGVPWLARVVALLVAAYAFSPIDLIPDFIPVLGYLDDLILIPLGVILVIKLIPPEIMEECRRQAEERPVSRRAGIAGAAVIVVIWVIVAGLVLTPFWPAITRWVGRAIRG